MKHYLLIFFSFFTLLLTAQENLSSLKFPEKLILKDLDGKNFDVKQMANGSNPFILDFWATWCGPCILKYDSMKPVLDEWKNTTGIEIYIVTIDKENDLANVKKLVKERGWNLKVLLDPEKKLFSAFNQGKLSIPQTFFFTPNGDLKFKTNGITVKISNNTADKDLRADLSDYYSKIQQISKN